MSIKYIWVVHLRSESGENYYRAFEHEPTDEQVLDYQREEYVQEYGEEPEDEYFTDLMAVRYRKRTELK